MGQRLKMDKSSKSTIACPHPPTTFCRGNSPDSRVINDPGGMCPFAPFGPLSRGPLVVWPEPDSIFGRNLENVLEVPMIGCLRVSTMITLSMARDEREIGVIGAGTWRFA